MRIALVARDSNNEADAILAYTRRLAAELKIIGADADVVLRTRDGAWQINGALPVRLLDEAVEGFDLVVLQYNPFLWGRRGFAPWLPLELWRIRRRQNRPRLVLMVHETFLQLRLPWRQALMSLWQQLQLRMSRPAADAIFVSIEAWTDELSRMRPKRPTLHLPVASNLPDARARRAEIRDGIGVTDDELVIATLSGGDPTRHLELIAAALHALLAAGRKPVLLALGVGGGIPRPLPSEIRVVEPGYLGDEELAGLLASADLFLAPFDDGVSTRRGSMMAALQHGLPVVATTGFLTDRLWASATPAVRLAPIDQPDLFAAAAVDIVLDMKTREVAGRAARELYTSHFDWPLIAARVLEQTRS